MMMWVCLVEGKLIKIAMKRQKKENIQHIQIRMGMMADCLW